MNILETILEGAYVREQQTYDFMQSIGGVYALFEMMRWLLMNLSRDWEKEVWKEKRVVKEPKGYYMGNHFFTAA